MSDRRDRRLPRHGPALRRTGRRRTWRSWRGRCAGGRCGRASSCGARGTSAGDGVRRRRAASRRRCASPASGRSRSARAGPGDMLGEIALLDGGAHTMSARVDRGRHVLALGRVDFAALLARQHPVGVQPEAPPRVPAAARLRAPAQPPRRLARRRAGRAAGRAMRQQDSRTSKYCGPPDSSTCAAWRRSTASTRWRSGAS